MSASEAEALSVSIAYAVRGAERQVQDFLRRPVTMADLVALQLDTPAAWEQWIESLRSTLAAVVTARKNHARLVALLGEDGQLVDHGWGNGLDTVTAATVGEAVDAAEVMVARLVTLHRGLKQTRRAAA